MSIPRIDPSYTTEDLYKDAKAFLKAGMKFWKGRAKLGMSGAVVWYKDEGGTVIFTRGEYDYKLTNNIEAQGPVYVFGELKE